MRVGVRCVTVCEGQVLEPHVSKSTWIGGVFNSFLG